MYPGIQEVLLSRDEISNRVQELAAQIEVDYKGNTNLVCISVLKGSFIFAADLVRELSLPVEIDCISISSYGKSSSSSGVVKINKDCDNCVEGKDLLIIEDIIDTGLTLSYLIKLLQDRNAASVRTAVFLDKAIHRTIDLDPDYVGFKIPDVFVVGYGLDYAERYRHLPFVGVLQEAVYK